MAQIENILFPVDFSPSCLAMAAYVKRAATLLGAGVSLVHIVDPGGYNALRTGLELYLLRPMAEVSEEHVAIGRERLDSFLTTDFPTAEYPRILASGDAATEIARVAKDGGFNLIIMPTHSGRFRQMLLGSTTAKVVNDADCPVLTSRHAETVAPRPLGHRELLCAVGLNSDSERVLRFATGIAREVHAKLTIIHALQGEASGLPVELDLEEKVRSVENREALGRIAELQRLVGSDAAVRVAAGELKKALLEAALLSDADVLIIGRSPRPGALGRMRDLTYALIRDSPFPVLSV
jgi:nucleotide-binding universal stress UspA family protein